MTGCQLLVSTAVAGRALVAVDETDTIRAFSRRFNTFCKASLVKRASGSLLHGMHVVMRCLTLLNTPNPETTLDCK